MAEQVAGRGCAGIKGWVSRIDAVGQVLRASTIAGDAEYKSNRQSRRSPEGRAAVSQSRWRTA
jgi:hypothetical protein